MGILERVDFHESQLRIVLWNSPLGIHLFHHAYDVGVVLPGVLQASLAWMGHAGSEAQGYA